MKVFFILTTSILALSSGSAFAQQSPTSNVTQTGLTNVIIAEQDGIGNNVSINVTNAQNGAAVDNSTVFQGGENNNLVVTIIGDENLFNISQLSDGAENDVNLRQTGGFNESIVTQNAAGFSEGLANLADITQIGNNNYASIEQTALASNVATFNNQALITQRGNDNLATSTQLGVNNISEQEQVGNDNLSQILQTGNDNLAIHRQFGDSLSLPNGFGGLSIEQTGGAEVIIEQFGAGITPPSF